MVERIEKVTPVKGVEYDVGRPFERKEGYGDGTKRDSAFRELLKQQMNKNATKSASEDEAYAVDIQRATQSLFYNGGVDLRGLGKDINGKG